MLIKVIYPSELLTVLLIIFVIQILSTQSNEDLLLLPSMLPRWGVYNTKTKCDANERNFCRLFIVRYCNTSYL